MHIIVIRHGETDLNKENRLQGSKGPNIGLNADGISMVENLRDGLLATPTRMFVSPLVRTTETATILNQRFQVPIIMTPELVERDFGTLSGKLRSEIDPQLLEDDLEEKYDYRPFGGESVIDVRTRILHFLSSLPLASNETVFVITHRGVIRLLYDLFPTHTISNEVIPASMHTFAITALAE